MERFRGRADLALNETGRRQAEAVALSIKGLFVSAIYASPLKRALETADIISECLGVPIQSLSGLIDIDYGSWQGLTPEEAARRDSELYTRWLECPHEVKFPRGESLGDVRARVMAAVERIAAEHSGETVILVSHKVVCQVLLCAILGLDDSHFWQINQDVSAINAFEIRDAVAAVTLLNDTCHLKSLTASR